MLPDAAGYDVEVKERLMAFEDALFNVTCTATDDDEGLLKVLVRGGHRGLFHTLQV